MVSALGMYLRATAAFGVGFVVVHGHMRRSQRISTTPGTEIMCISRDAMIGAFAGPFLPLYALTTRGTKCPCTDPPNRQSVPFSVESPRNG